ncbi:hypothetical protein GCM10011512_26720 [Tersicoccus solisilvae]|uniref:SAV-6107-like HEPN domain-containing protein n=1 Tax=Tersicoccus solisilvae TaxID=1882339 RepID=A0ABQ1PJY0_9MICC|nr:hypothetical protein [Tersicoccus solisilvae]GGC98452.1 hypothetical protein GCM10011512_26720 [Tersicoccus solisilvae]
MAGFFSGARAARRDDARLGRGVWRRAHDRFRRGLDRYHQVIEEIDDDAVANALVLVADDLAGLLPRVRAVCEAAHRAAPSEGSDIPASAHGWLSDVHRALTRSGNALAATAEAAAMVRLGAGGLDAVQRRATGVEEFVRAAEEVIAAGPGGDG